MQIRRRTNAIHWRRINTLVLTCIKTVFKETEKSIIQGKDWHISSNYYLQLKEKQHKYIQCIWQGRDQLFIPHSSCFTLDPVARHHLIQCVTSIRVLKEITPQCQTGRQSSLSVPHANLFNSGVFKKLHLVLISYSLTEFKQDFL